MLVELHVPLSLASLEKRIDRDLQRNTDDALITFSVLAGWYEQLLLAIVTPGVYLPVFLDGEAVVLSRVDLTDLLLVELSNELRLPHLFGALCQTQLTFMVVAP